MGGKSQKQTSTSTIGPPGYISDAYQGLVGQAQNQAAQPFTPYGGQLVADLTPQQQAGIAGVSAAQGAWAPYIGQASTLYGQSAQSIAPTAFSANALQQYMNPYQQQVIDATMAQTAENDRRQQNDLTGQAIQAGAWGGDRAGVAKAALAGQQKLAADQTIAGLNASNYNQALGAFQQQQGVGLAAQQADAARKAAAASGIAGLGTTSQDAALKDAMAQIEAGGVQQQNTQQGLSAAYDQWMQGQSYPFESLSWLANILTGVGSSAGSTSAGITKGSSPSGVGSILGGALSLGSALFSDERVKEDIEQVGETNDGQPIYRFRYKGDPVMRMGLMAQDVETSHPEAVKDIGGIKAVDYEAATNDAARDGFAGGGGVQGVPGIPYGFTAKRIIPDIAPIKGRGGLMQAPPAPNLPSSQQSGSQDLSKLGSQLGGIAGKAFGQGGIFGSSGATGGFDANTPRFNFQSGLQLFGPGFAKGGIVPSDATDMEQGADGVYRPGYAFGGDIDFFDPNPIDYRNVGVSSGDAPASDPVASGGPGGFSPNDIDAIVRTVYGEANRETPEGQRAVAEVIRNRAMQGNMSPTDVVLAKGQFEPWATRRAELQGLDPNSPVYQSILKTIMPTINGEVPDVTGPDTTHFYAPKAQAAHGRNAPSWDDGSGTDIGNHRFFDIGYGGSPSSGGVAAARPVTATAYAPDDGSGVKTDAFNGVTAGQGIAAPLAAPVATGSTASDADKGFGLGYLPRDVQMALIAAGLGMMASRGRSAGEQIGEGGLAGLQFYTAAQAARRKELEDASDKARKSLTEDRDYGLRSRAQDVQEKSLLQRAQEAKERLGLTDRQQTETERHNKVSEDKSKFSAIPGTGMDADGNQVPGTYVFDQGTGDMKFQPGMVAGARKDPEADLQRKSEFDRLKSLNDDAEAARTVKGSVANLRELRKGVSYSGIPGAKLLAPVAGMVGNGGGQALESAATNFKIDLSSKLKGAISDKEQAMLQAATPGIGMSDQAANQVLDTYEGVSERAIERNKFYQAWRARNKTLAGADDAWDRYVQENPVVSAGQNGSLSLNRKNLGNWQRYVATTAPKATAPSSQTPQAQGSGDSAPVSVASPEEARKLPPGTKFVTPDGRVFRVPVTRSEGGDVGGGGGDTGNDGGANNGPAEPPPEPQQPIVFALPNQTVKPGQPPASTQPYGGLPADMLGNAIPYHDLSWLKFGNG